MKDILQTLIGFALAFGGGVGLTIYQAHPVTRDGEQQYVVAWIRKNKVVETPIFERCLVVGLGCGIFGGAIGSRIGAGGGLIATAVGAALGWGGALFMEGEMPNRHGLIGEQSEVLTRVFLALLGATVASSASVKVQEIREGRPS